MWLASSTDEHSGFAGLLLQKLPGASEGDVDAQASWQHLTTLADTVKPEELLGLMPQELLHRLFHADNCVLDVLQAVHLQCRCDEDRIVSLILNLGWKDAKDLLKQEQGLITVDCGFCNQQYRFDAPRVDALFAAQASLHDTEIQ